MKLPPISHLQFAIIDALADGREHSSQDLRAQLWVAENLPTFAAFYQLMARMEKSGLVSGHYDLIHQPLSNGTDHWVKIRLYAITPKGQLSRVETLNYYKAIPMNRTIKRRNSR